MTEEKTEIEVSKESFLEAFADLRPDLFFPDEWTPAQKEMASEELRPRKVKTAMFSQIPMVCQGEVCPYAKVCPLLAKGIAPTGSPCPLEMAIVTTFAENYMKEFGVSHDNLVEASMVRDLVDFEVQYMRAVKILAQEHFIQDNPVGMDADGNVVVRSELHQAVEYEERILKRKEKLLNAFLATREARNKAGQGVADASQQISELLDRARDYAAEKDRITKEKLGIKAKDAYIDAFTKDSGSDD